MLFVVEIVYAWQTRPTSKYEKIQEAGIEEASQRDNEASDPRTPSDVLQTHAGRLEPFLSHAEAAGENLLRLHAG